jgi:autotransporter-associated beta strand protein
VFDNGTLIADRSDSVIYGGMISRTGSLIKEGGATLTLSGTNSYGGATIISSGILQGGATESLSPNSTFNVLATLDLNGFSNTIGSLAGSGTITNSSATPVVLSVGHDNTTTTFSGVINDGSSSLGLTKIGSGTLVLSGTNTW